MSEGAALAASIPLILLTLAEAGGTMCLKEPYLDQVMHGQRQLDRHVTVRNRQLKWCSALNTKVWYRQPHTSNVVRLPCYITFNTQQHTSVKALYTKHSLGHRMYLSPLATVQASHQ